MDLEIDKFLLLRVRRYLINFSSNFYLNQLFLQFTDSECSWSETDETERRRTFCNQVEGYGNVCSCKNPLPISFNPAPVSWQSKSIILVSDS